MKILLFVLLFSCFSKQVFAQQFFNKDIGGDKDDEAITVRQSFDGGYYITGNTKSRGQGGSDVYLVKVDAKGGIVWEKTFGGQKDDFGWGMRVLKDGDVVITGFTDSQGSGKDDVLVIRTDANGNEKWQKTFGGAYDDRSWDVIEAKDNTIVIAGEFAQADNKVNVDGWLMKLDAGGNTIWSNKYGYAQGNDRVDRLFSVADTEHGFILSGFTNSTGAGDFDVLLINTDEKGNEVWRKTFGGKGFEVGHTVRLMDTRGYMIAGYSRSFNPNGKGDVYMIQTDLKGNVLKEKSFGEDVEERTLTFTEGPNGGYALLGYAEITNDNWDAYLAEVDKDLNLIRSKKIGDKFLDTGGHNILRVGNDYVFVGYINHTGVNKNIYITRVAMN